MSQIEKCYSCSYLDTFNCCCSKEPIMMCVSDLVDHDKQIRYEVIDEVINRLCFSEIISYKANDIKRILAQMKGEQNE